MRQTRGDVKGLRHSKMLPSHPQGDKLRWTRDCRSANSFTIHSPRCRPNKPKTTMAKSRLRRKSTRLMQLSDFPKRYALQDLTSSPVCTRFLKGRTKLFQKGGEKAFGGEKDRQSHRSSGICLRVSKYAWREMNGVVFLLIKINHMSHLLHQDFASVCSATSAACFSSSLSLSMRCISERSMSPSETKPDRLNAHATAQRPVTWRQSDSLFDV